MLAALRHHSFEFVIGEGGGRWCRHLGRLAPRVDSEGGGALSFDRVELGRGGGDL